MEIIAEYINDVITGNGCGGHEAGGSMYINSGGGTPANLHTFEIYRMPLNGYSAENAPNIPEAELIFSDISDRRDSHGMVLTKNGRSGTLHAVVPISYIGEDGIERADAHGIKVREQH